VADAMAAAALGTDTGGSCRIPAALCGIAGFKPSQNRVPLDGAFPLSPSLDSIGPLAPSAACCALIDRILAGAAPVLPPARPLSAIRLAVPQTLVLDDLDAIVAHNWLRTLTALSRAGIQVVELPLRELAEIAEPRVRHSIAAAEAWAIHRPRLRDPAIGPLYDPNVSARIARGAELDVADYIDLLALRRDFRRRVNAATAGFDAMIMPTCPITAPAIADVSNDETYPRVNILLLRNTSVTNFLDGTALSLPSSGPGEAPVGLMIAGENGADDRILSVGQALETVLASAA
jgi:aspartyl-tRNA(Asn)/glutamyl-tRNA(Gln) amidotransferase subunit A